MQVANPHRLIYREAVKKVVAKTLGLCLTLTPLLACGCMFNSGGDVDAVQPVSNLPRAGNVYILRGFMGVLSPGLDDLRQQCESDGVRAQVYENDQWREIADRLIARYRPDPRPEPLILIGHSFGADDAILISRRLAEASVEVDLLITLDPVLPEAVPVNVRRTINFYCPNGVTDFLPVFRGVDLKAADPSVALTNVDLNRDDPALAEQINHFTIGENQQMRSEVLKLVLDVCPPKADWLLMPSHPATNPTAVSSIHPWANP
ncbi:MAG: hypothetical protein IT446_14390 [Phycisphaerales bacterium]|nr:hypothetical protein [Phycisphaerales bacterium]